MPNLDSTPPPENGYTFSIIPEWVLDHERLSHGAVRLYGVLARYSDPDGVSWPSRTTLANRLRCTTVTIDRWAGELVEVEALTITRRKGKSEKHNLTNLWKIRKVPTSVLPPRKTGLTTLGKPLFRRTKANERKPKKESSLLDKLIEKEKQ